MVKTKAASGSVNPLGFRSSIMTPFIPYPQPLRTLHYTKNFSKSPLDIYTNPDCTNNLGVKVPCAHGLSPDSTKYSFASVPINEPKSVKTYAINTCGEPLPADSYTANSIVDLHNQYRAQVSSVFLTMSFGSRS